MDDSLCDKYTSEEKLSSNVRYADDATLISVVFEKLKLSSQELENVCREMGFKDQCC